MHIRGYLKQNVKDAPFSNLAGEVELHFIKIEKMKKVIVLLVMFVSLQSCFKSDDEKLEMARVPYTGNALKLNGFYYGGTIYDGKKAYDDVFILFRNGVVCNPGSFMDPVEGYEMIIKNVDYSCKADWGVFQVSGDNILVNQLRRVTRSYASIVYGGKILNDTTFVLTKIDGEDLGETREYKFHASQFKPDSTTTLIK